MSETHEFERGRLDGEKDRAAGVKALGETILNRMYSPRYREGYNVGYAGTPREERG